MIKAVLWIILAWLLCMYYAIGRQTDEADEKMLNDWEKENGKD